MEAKRALVEAEVAYERARGDPYAKSKLRHRVREAARALQEAERMDKN